MNYRLIIVLLFCSFGTFCQTANIQGLIQHGIDSSSSIAVSVELSKQGQIIGDVQSNQEGLFCFENLYEGNYKLDFSFVGYDFHSITNIEVKNDTSIHLNVKYPCPNGDRHSKKYCPYGHEDDIVHIVYGYPHKRTIRKAKRGKIYLAGCLVTECDPKWYCKEHKISF